MSASDSIGAAWMEDDVYIALMCMVFTVCVLVSLYRRQRRKVPPVLPPPQSFATWITDSSDVVRNLPLNQVAFPGSHNSGAYNICGNVVSGDCHASLVPYIQRLPFVSSFVARWATCQRLSITEQLQAGVRYLDIRVQAFPSGAPRVCHSLCSISLHECIAQVRAFLDEHPTELVILDVNHIYVTSPSQYIVIGEQLVDQLGRHCIARRSDSPSSCTLASLCQQRIQVVLVYHDQESALRLDLWGPSHIQSPWPRVADNVVQYAQTHLQGRNVSDDQLYVTQVVPTARPVDLLCHLNVLTFVRPLLIHALLWLQQLAEQRGDLPTLSAVNIVMVDDCGIDQYAVIAAILNLNKAKTG
ncbi:hypothetical protein H257_11073 [Aphanomyces astaci]|uniref:Phosphatidylinositol-specific phospholipase C X domain-containing protein n=1 Tax=Aphanomyces astaci TaxID=112090 RepID=W4G336_APHAT|nr:hypothetical protein H257_11073 [Aphanomyces astaci]ETV74107.1 hypothetical protein H257_11073 [Aphanomyces astaci]|eukprot:XP_009836213.1 hypothetical protein H257_11073 [Aphanomyces astaci]